MPFELYQVGGSKGGGTGEGGAVHGAVVAVVRLMCIMLAKFDLRKRLISDIDLLV